MRRAGTWRRFQVILDLVITSESCWECCLVLSVCAASRLPLQSGLAGSGQGALTMYVQLKWVVPAQHNILIPIAAAQNSGVHPWYNARKSTLMQLVSATQSTNSSRAQLLLYRVWSSAV